MILGLKMIVALGVVLLVFAAAVFIFKKLSVSSKGLGRLGKGGGKPLEVLAFQSLGPSRNLYLLRCLDKKILVGCTNTQINHIADIVEEDGSDNDLAFEPLMETRGSIEEERSSLKNEHQLREIARV